MDIAGHAINLHILLRSLPSFLELLYVNTMRGEARSVRLTDADQLMRSRPVIDEIQRLKKKHLIKEALAHFAAFHHYSWIPAKNCLLASF
jgi:septation ring formation regulator EzrA